MQEEGTTKFLLQKNNSPTCIAYSPKDRYTFAFGGSDGEIALLSALRGESVRTIQLTSLSLARALNSITFSPDGTKVITTAVSRKVSIIDVERGDPVLAYDNCASPGEGRQPLVMHPDMPYLAACATVNMRGITLIDLRMPLPLDFIYDIHEDSINDMCFLDGSWPWGSGKMVLVSGSSVGQMKVNSVDGRPICSFTAPSPLTSMAPSPEAYNKTVSQGYPSVMMASTGEGLVCWCVGERPWKWESQQVSPNRVTRMRYSHSGGILYTAQDLVSAGHDNSIGLLRLGPPSHGWTQYCEFT